MMSLANAVVLPYVVFNMHMVIGAIGGAALGVALTP